MSASLTCTLGVLVALSFCTPSLKGQVLLQDDFNDNSINTQLWSVVTAGVPGNPGVVERNQRMELISRGHLVTNAQMDPVALGGIRIQGTWTVAQAPCHDYLHILTRSDGVPSGRFGDTQHGLEFFANTEENACRIYTKSSLITLGNATMTGSVAFRIGGTYSFDILDSGSAATFTMVDLATSARWSVSCSVLADSTLIKHVVFHNRESVCGTNVAHLDDVVITGGHLPSFSLFGSGCAGTRGLPQLAVSQLPRIGHDFAVRLTNLPPSQAAVIMLGVSNTAWLGIPLPLDLSDAGMPGCTLYTSIDSFRVVGTGSGSVVGGLPIPFEPSLLGGVFFSQVLITDPPANATGLILTSAGRGVIGS